VHVDLSMTTCRWGDVRQDIPSVKSPVCEAVPGLVRFEAEAQQKGRREPLAKLTHSDVNSIGARCRVSTGS